MVVDKDALVRDYWHRGHWKLALIRNGSLEDSTSLACLKRLLQGISPGNEDLDTPVWRWERKGDFSVKSTYRFLIDRGLRLTHKKLNWETKCPLKVHIFMWLVANDTILTWNNLQRRGWEGPSPALCYLAPEDGNHLLLTCPYSLTV